MKNKYILDQFEMLERYKISHKRYLISEIGYIMLDLVGFDKEIMFSEPIKEYDKIRIEDYKGVTLHYNGENGGEGWIELDIFFDISIIYDILSEIRIYTVENL